MSITHLHIADRLKAKPMFLPFSNAEATATWDGYKTEHRMPAYPGILKPQDRPGRYRHLQPGDTVTVQEPWWLKQGTPQSVQEVRYHTQAIVRSASSQDSITTRASSYTDFAQKQKTGWVLQGADRMPKWAARMDLLITEVQFAKVQEMDELAHRWEGMAHPLYGGEVGRGDPLGVALVVPSPSKVAILQQRYKIHWDQRFKGLPWAKNPEVVILTFLVTRRPDGTVAAGPESVVMDARPLVKRRPL